MPNIFAELMLTAMHTIAMYVIFCRLHRPDRKWKWIVACCLIVLRYPILFAYHIMDMLNSGFNVLAEMFIGLLILLILASLCYRENDRIRPFVSAFYVLGMSWIFAFVCSCYSLVIFGRSMFTYQPFSLPLYSYILIEEVVVLFWAIFYYRIARKMTSSTPLSFSILIILMPFATLGLVAIVFGSTEHLLSEESGQLIAEQSGLFLYGALLGTLILIFNMCIFYLYVRLSIAYESVRLAQELAHTPPVWTVEQGLSTLFIEKYQITPREQQVIETMLAGKSDKEISLALELAVGTVQAHLKRVYRKTGVTGRFALAALVRGAG